MHLQMTVVWEGCDRSPLEVVVDSPRGATAADLVTGLRALVGPAVPTGPMGSTWSLNANGVPVDGEAPIGDGRLVDGAVLTVAPVGEPAAPGARRSTSPLTLAVTSGPDAGREFPLLPGTVRLGRGTSADLTVADPDLSRSHVRVTVTTDGVHVRDDGSTNGTRVADRPVPDGGQPLQASDTVAVGSSRIQVRAPRRRPAAVTQPREGVRLVNRSPRLPRPVQPRTFTLPPEPQRPHRGRLPWVAMLAPLPVGVVLAVLFSPAMLAFALMGPLLMGATAVSDRFQGRRTYAVQLAEHAAAVRRVRASALVAVAEERQGRHLGLPDPAEVLAVACGPSTRLWERRRDDPDALELRLGTWVARSLVRVVAPGPDVEPEVLEMPDSPCAVPLGAIGILGVAGPVATTEAVGRNLVGQVAALHSHRDATLWVLVARRVNCAAWQWVSRLPHNRTSDGGRRLACLEADESATVAAVHALLGEVEQRQRSTGSAQPWLGPRAVVVLVGAGELREVPGVATLLDQGPAVGIAVIALDDGAGRLPSECRAVVEAVSSGGRTSWRLTTADDAGGHSLVVDQVGPWWADRLSRALAPLRDSTPDEASETLPDTVRLLDLLPFDALDSEAVVRQWTELPATTRAPLGVSTGGPCTIDLRRDGPHVLVGGTTGSGKSELLRTLIAGLAAGNRPDRLAFVLVDYKGGAAFRECASLPHTTGLVTDLDAHLTARALTSLTAELKRREALLASVGARDLDEWVQQRRPDHPPLPRLVIVIDEFRVLAEEYPDFIAGLVRIAAVGRSLGVHLVLATQRPAGVVSADIKANVNLRIALRVRDRADSDDVIDCPAAAGISERTPGRAFARSGSEPPQPFQTATVAGRSPAPRRLTVTAADWTAGVPRAVSHPETAVPPGAAPDGAGDLADLVASLREAAATLAVGSAPSPWLPPLPERLASEDLRRPAAAASGLLVPLGLVDRPSEQRQEPLVWDLAQPGHWAAIGTTGCGRTGFLRVLAHEAVARLAPAQLHLYAVDGGRGGLQDLTALPHTGAVVSRDDPGRLERLVRRLEGEVARRRSLASELPGHPMRRSPAPAPAPAPATMLLLVDDWDLVTHELDSLDHGLLTERLVTLLREGSGVGLRAAVTGDRGLLHGRLASLFTERLVLRLADPADAVLAGLSRSALPPVQPPGRAVLCSDGAEVQLTLPAEGRPSGTAARHHAPCQVQTPHQAPLRVEPLPNRVALGDLLGHALTGDPVDPGRVVVGVGGDDLHPVGLDPHRDGPLWLVAGSTRSGKSTALRTLGEGLLLAGRPIGVVSSRPGPLDRLRDRPGVACWSSADDRESVVAAWRDSPGLAVLVDDADQLLDTAVEPALRDLVRAARQGQALVACAASTSSLLTQYRGVAVEVARSQVGLLLNPRGVADGELFGLASGRRHVATDRHPGRGLLVTAAGPVEVQVATSEWEADTKPLQPA